MKQPRIDAFVDQKQAKALASTLDHMPVIRPPAQDIPAAGQHVTPPEPPLSPVATEPTREPPPALVPSPTSITDTMDAGSLDLGQLPYRKHSCLLTPEEFNALDELKVAMRKKLGGTVSKESLTRCAIHYMIEDFQRHGDASPVPTLLKKLVKEW
jgi:hypothetical protein